MKALEQLQRIWAGVSPVRPQQRGNLDINALVKTVVGIFSAGDYYSYLFNVPESIIEYVSPAAQQVLGWPIEELNTAKIISLVHPEDLPYLVKFEAAVISFIKSLHPDEVKDYKMRYDYRLRKRTAHTSGYCNR